jgi:hypothetical protein
LLSPALIAKEQWLFHDNKMQAPIMQMILHPLELDEMLNRGVFRMKMKADAAKAAALLAKSPFKTAVPAEKSSFHVTPQGPVSPGRGFHQSGAGGERYRMAPLCTFKVNKRGVAQQRTP